MKSCAEVFAMLMTVSDASSPAVAEALRVKSHSLAESGNFRWQQVKYKLNRSITVWLTSVVVNECWAAYPAKDF